MGTTVFATVSTPGPAGPQGVPGYSPQFIVAPGAPGAGAGNNGDMYINSSTGDVYGPKVAGAWGAIVCNIKGSTGAAGATGPPGYSPIYHVGAGAPAAGLGLSGDMYIDSNTSDVYGPKTSGAWGAIQCNIKGATGAQGAPGVAYTPRGAWAAGTTYAQGDEVTYSSQLYIGLVAGNLGNVPSSSPTWWQLVGSGASQTPWLSNIDGGNFTLGNVNRIAIGAASPAAPLWVHVSAGLNVSTGYDPTRTVAYIGATNDAGNTNQPLAFQASSFNFYNYTGSGFVGIGVASPICKLSLGQDITAHKLALYDDGANFYGLGMDSSQIRYEAAGGGGHNFYVNGPTFAATITAAGRVGIGIANPCATEVISSPAGVYPPVSLTSQTPAIWECGITSGPGLGLFNEGSPRYGMILQTRHQTASNNPWELLINPLGGNVGIGPAPYTYGGAVAPLDIGVNTPGGINVLSLKCGIAATGDGPVILFGQNTGSALQAQIQAYYDTSTAGLGFKFITWNNVNLAERVRITGPGFVGIGGVPICKLSLGSDVTARKLAVYDNGATYYGFGLDATAIRYEAGSGGGHSFYVNGGTQAVTILSNGNLAVGTTQSTTAKSTVAVTNTTPYSAGSAATWATTLVQNLTNTAGCAVGIGFTVTSSYPGNDSVAAGMAAVLISSAVDTQLDLAFITRPSGNASQERMRITAAGLVGIGRTPTTYPLEVVGDVNCTGAFRVNGTAIGATGPQGPAGSTGPQGPAGPTGGAAPTAMTTGGRVADTPYQNTSGKSRWVSIVISFGQTNGSIAYCDPTSSFSTQIAVVYGTTAAPTQTLTFLVLPNYWYKLLGAAGVSIASWYEWT